MSKAQQKQRNQTKLSRLEIVAKLYKRGYSVREIRTEVMKRLELKTYSLRTVHNDIQSLLKEWRETRIEDIDQAIQLELERIDEIVRELWEQWEKSKNDYTKTSNKRKGAPIREKNGTETIKTYQREQTETAMIMLGDPSYLAEIRHQLAERRKLLGLYAPDKKDITGDFSFAAFLMESGMIDDEEEK